jgi:hypothetical protein
MNFYFSVFQLHTAVDGIKRNARDLANNALRLSPRDSLANRELLEQCERQVHTVGTLLKVKANFSKVALRNVGLLHEMLDLSYRRLFHLANATTKVKLEDQNSINFLWQCLNVAQGHYRGLTKKIFDWTGMGITLTLRGDESETGHNFLSILEKESFYQQETLKLLEKAIEIFGEEQALKGQLGLMRKELLESRKRFKEFGPTPVFEKIEARQAVLTARR